MSLEATPNKRNTQQRMVLVAVLVCLFASGMAGMLNFFKYRATAERLIVERLVVTGQSIEASIRSSLALGMQFSDLATLPEKMARELRTDDLTKTIEIFDNEGNALYSTDQLRAARGSYSKWLAASREAENGVWVYKDGPDSAVGIAVKNTIGLVIGQLTLRFNEQQVNAPIAAVGKKIALMSLLAFLASATLSSLALVAVMRGITRDMDLVGAFLDGSADAEAEAALMRGPFAKPLKRFLDTVRSVELNIGMLRKQLSRQPSA